MTSPRALTHCPKLRVHRDSPDPSWCRCPRGMDQWSVSSAGVWLCSWCRSFLQSLPDAGCRSPGPGRYQGHPACRCPPVTSSHRNVLTWLGLGKKDGRRDRALRCRKIPPPAQLIVHECEAVAATRKCIEVEGLPSFPEDCMFCQWQTTRSKSPVCERPATHPRSLIELPRLLKPSSNPPRSVSLPCLQRKA